MEEAHVEAEAKLHSASQRQINRIWEFTQAIIALSVTGSTLYATTILIINTDNAQTEAFILLSNAFFLIVGFYFGRTNHTRVGGIRTGR